MTARRDRLGLVAAALLSVAMRLRFVFTPISSDEGGYLAIARAWRHGKDLYGDVWVDRPQGVLLVYRFYDVVIGEEDLLRIIALVFGIAAVAAVAEAVRSVSRSREAALVAAFFAAVLTASPAIEGYAANGELLGGAASAASVAVACAVLVDRLSGRWMIVAGVLGGFAWSLKQSGIDGPLAVGAWLLVAASFGWSARRVLLVRLGQLALGAGAVVGVLALHGWVTGWSDWWYAVFGYRREKRSVFEDAQWWRIREWGRDAIPVFATVVFAGIAAAVVSLRARHRLVVSPVAGVFVAWMLTATVSFLAGGQFFRHYYVILAFPVAALCGLAVGSLPANRRRAMVAAAALVVPVVSWLSLAVKPRDEVPIAISDEPRPLIAERVGHWLDDHAADGDTLYVMCAAAHAYAHAEMDPEYRYLWFDGVRQGRDSQEELVALFTGPDPPTWVAAFDRAVICENSGVVADVLEAAYTEVDQVDGVPIYRLNAP